MHQFVIKAIGRFGLMQRRAFVFSVIAVTACTADTSPDPTASTLTDDDALAYVHPELRQSAEAILDSGWKPSELSDDNLEAIRNSSTSEAPDDNMPVSEVFIPGTEGAPEVRILVVNSLLDGSDRPGLIYLHGGGYVLGSADNDIPYIQELASTLDCVVVAVDYRLAPETQWSGSLEDNYSSLKWLYDNAAELGVDRTRIAVMGISAGGGHAALLAIAARDRGEVPLVLQSLIYPMLDDRTGSSHPTPAHVGTLVWTAAANRYGWRSFLGHEPGKEDVLVEGVPARVGDLAGLAPTFIGVGDIDLFVDENLSYARRLINAGVPTELVVVPGAFHAFDFLAPQAGIAKQFNEAKYNALRRAFRQEIPQ